MTSNHLIERGLIVFTIGSLAVAYLSATLGLVGLVDSGRVLGAILSSASFSFAAGVAYFVLAQLRIRRRI